MKKILTVLAMAALLPAVAQLRSPLLGGSRRSTSRPVNTSRPTPPAPQPSAGDEATPSPTGGHALNWDGAASDIIIMAYGDEVGKTILKDPACPSATITLKSKQGQKLSREEYLEAIETVLEMNGIHLEPYKDSFIRALPRKDVRKEGIPILMDSDTKLGESGKVVSMMIPFTNMTAEDAQKVLEGFKSNAGLLIVFERTNKILVTDTEQNINRMLEIARAIDVAAPVTEQVFVRQIKHAAVDDVQKALQAIVDDAMKWQEKNKAPTNPSSQQQQPFNRPMALNLLRRPGQQQQPQPQPVNNESLVMTVSDADRGMIRGKVLIVPDERSNKLIVITSKANMDFFDKVIEQLDVETTPDTVVKVYRLKYADAEDVSDMINDLIGNSSSSKSNSKNTNQNAKQGTGGNITRNNNTAASAAARKPANQRTGEAKAGELSKENTTVLADKRINGLVVMTNKELVPTIESIIESMDIKLSQVLIETVIIEVQLGDDISTGIDWVHGMQAKGGRYQQAIGGGGGQNSVAMAADGLTDVLINAVGKSLPALFTPGGVGLTYGVYSERLDLGAVIKASKNDSRSKYVASPVIMTVDNKEATIDATQKRQFLTGYQVSSSVYASGNSTAPQYSSEELGITIKVTPKINPNGTVMLEVSEEYSQLGAKQTILDPSSNEVQIDTSLKRKMEADVLLENSQTVVLGGLTETKISESEGGIPILKDIPWIGKYLFGSTSSSETRNELLVFMTPYVLDDSEAAQVEALRRKKVLSDPRPWDDRGWSASALADPVSKKEQLRRIQDEWKKQDEERQARIAVEQEKIKRAKKLEALSVEERNLWLKMHKDELEEEAQEELEEKMLDEKSQSALKKLAEEIRAKKLAEAAAEEKKAGAVEKAKGE